MYTYVYIYIYIYKHIAHWKTNMAAGRILELLNSSNLNSVVVIIIKFDLFSSEFYLRHYMLNIVNSKIQNGGKQPTCTFFNYL